MKNSREAKMRKKRPELPSDVAMKLGEERTRRNIPLATLRDRTSMSLGRLNEIFVLRYLPNKEELEVIVRALKIGWKVREGLLRQYKTEVRARNCSDYVPSYGTLTTRLRELSRLAIRVHSRKGKSKITLDLVEQLIHTLESHIAKRQRRGAAK